MSSLLQYLDNNEKTAVTPTVETKPISTEPNTEKNLSKMKILQKKINWECGQ